MRPAAAHRLATATALAQRSIASTSLGLQLPRLARRRLATRAPSHSPRPAPRVDQRRRRAIALAGGALAFAATYVLLSPPVQADEPRSKGKGKARDRLIRLSELREHGADAERIWVTRGDGVYDVCALLI